MTSDYETKLYRVYVRTSLNVKSRSGSATPMQIRLIRQHAPPQAEEKHSVPCVCTGRSIDIVLLRLPHRLAFVDVFDQNGRIS